MRSATASAALKRVEKTLGVELFIRTTRHLRLSSAGERYIPCGNRASNDGDLVSRWCVAGKGMAVKACLDMAADLLSGNVVNVMPEFKPTPTELWLICPSRQSITPAVRLLRDTFREKSRAILNQLIANDILKDSVLT